MPRKSIAPEMIPSSIADMVTQRRVKHASHVIEQSKIQQRLHDAEECIRRQSLRLIDVEDLVTIGDALIAEYDRDDDAPWSRERVGSWVARLREARVAMVNQDPPDMPEGI